MIKQLTLLDVPATDASRGAKLAALKKEHGILTHRSGCLGKGEKPWIALLPIEEDKGKDLFDIMAESCRLYDESGWCAYAEGELSAVRLLCQQRGIACEL
jgi:hypothetical protein